MSVRDDIYDLVHEALLAAWAVDGATAAKIIPANRPGTKPAAPFVTVRLLAMPDLSSPDAKRVVSGSDVLQSGRQARDARVALQAFGDDAVAWLDSLSLRMAWPDVLDVVAMRETSAPRDLTAFLDAGFEARAEMEIGVYVEVIDDRSATLIPAATVSMDAFDDTIIFDLE